MKLDVQGQGGGRILDVDIHKAIPFERKTNQRGGSILIYEKTDLIYKVRKDLSISDKDKEILTIEIISKESKNILLSCYYRHHNPAGNCMFKVNNKNTRTRLLLNLSW